MDLQRIREYWEYRVAADYRAGRIISERDLQALLYSYINASFPTLDVYVEPKLRYYENGTPSVKPDLVVCDKASIHLFVEIKFIPHGYPGESGDLPQDLTKLKKLKTEDRNKNNWLNINPHTGYFYKDNPSITDNTHLAVFVIGQADGWALDPDKVRSHEEASPIAEHLSIFYGQVRSAGEITFGSSVASAKMS